MNNMPTITKNLLIINTLMFAGTWVATRYNIDLENLLGLHFFLASDFHLYQIFTYMFMHGNLEHLFFNMFAVWMFGRIMEQTMGPQRFLTYYLVCGIGAGFMQEFVQYISYIAQGLNAYEEVSLTGIHMEMAEYLNRWTTVGASGAVYGILLSFGMTFPEEKMFIFPLPVPIKAKFFVIGYAVIELLSALGQSNDGVAHFAHLGGMVVGFFLLLYWRNGNGYGGYGNSYRTKNSLSQWWKGIKNKFRKTDRTRFTINQGGKFDADMEYNARKKEQEEEMDRILDKIKKGGYNALTEEEKRKIFDASNRR